MNTEYDNLQMKSDEPREPQRSPSYSRTEVNQ
jgi:hypothetical protein